MAGGHIFIGIPTADQNISTGTSKSLYRLALALHKNGISTSLYFAESADIIENRNILSAYFMESKASHLLQIDSDISFEPQVVADMVNLKVPLVGAAYPKRRIDMKTYAAIYAKLGEIKDPEERFAVARACASQFPFIVKVGSKVVKGFVEAEGIPAGLLLTEKKVFQKMIDNPEKAKLDQMGPTPLWQKGGHHGFFDRVWIPEKKYWLSEDLSFCHRWVKGLGEKIYAYIGKGVVHHGTMAYDANYLDFAKNRAAFERIQKQKPVTAKITKKSADEAKSEAAEKIVKAVKAKSTKSAKSAKSARPKKKAAKSGK